MSDSLILKFCQAISGVDETSQRQAESVIREARNRFSDETVDCLLERFAKGGISEVTVDECLAGVARAITFFLYVGVLPDAEGQELSAESSTKLIIRELFRITHMACNPSPSAGIEWRILRPLVLSTGGST
jgi:hypothetical protein